MNTLTTTVFFLFAAFSVRAVITDKQQNASLRKLIASILGVAVAAMLAVSYWQRWHGAPLTHGGYDRLVQFVAFTCCCVAAASMAVIFCRRAWWLKHEHRN